MNNPCSVRALTDTDLPLVLEWRNHPDVRRFMFTQHIIDLEEHRQWFDRVKGDDTRRLLIVEDNGLPIGFVQFNPVSVGGVADWGFYARPDAPKGSGTKLGHAALGHAFEQLGLHKVCGQAVENNQVSIALHKKLGFRQEGVLQEPHRMNNTNLSVICFGLQASEWQTRIKSTRKSNNDHN